MPRFEMYLFMALEDEDDDVRTEEYEMVCFVNNSLDVDEVTQVAHGVVEKHIEESDGLVLFGTAGVMVKGAEILNLAFRNKDIDSEKIDEIMDLYSHESKTIH